MKHIIETHVFTRTYGFNHAHVFKTHTDLKSTSKKIIRISVITFIQTKRVTDKTKRYKQKHKNRKKETNKKKQIDKKRDEYMETGKNKK